MSWCAVFRYRQIKAAAPGQYQHRLMVRVLTAWRARTAAKQAAEQQRRVAVRHHYLTVLGKSLRAWCCAMQAAGQKQEQLAAARAHHKTRLLSAVLEVGTAVYIQHQYTGPLGCVHGFQSCTPLQVASAVCCLVQPP